MNVRFLAFSSLLFLASCASTSEITSYIEPKFKESSPISPSENIRFNFSQLKSNPDPVKATQVESDLIPALIYWEWKNVIKCEVDPKVVAQTFQKEFTYYADSLQLSDKLKDLTLELQVEQIPSNFVYVSKGHFLFMLFFYSYSYGEAFAAYEVQYLRIKYNLTQNGSLFKSGELSALSELGIVRNFSTSTKKFTQSYVDALKLDTKKMTKKIITKLLVNV